LKNINAVIFDLDDTLLDRSKTFSSYSEYLVDNFIQNKTSFDEKKNIILMLKDMDKNGYENRTVFYNKIVETWGLKYMAEDLEQNWFEQFDKHSVPAYKLIETLEYVYEKYKLAIITNGSSYMQNKKVDALGIRKYFNEIIISNDVGIKKPEKDIFILCCDRLNIVPSEAVYIGDNYEIDIMGAIGAGLNAIWIDKFKSNGNYEPKINELKSITQIL
jgi:putative hydrolase of the HAD superfamily